VGRGRKFLALGAIGWQVFAIFVKNKAMLDSLQAFFRRLFGDSDPALIEDAADLGLENLNPPPATQPRARQGTDASRSRSLVDEADESVSSVIDVTGSQGISLAQPRYLWCLDNGHGSEQAGKRSPRLEDGTRLEEWAFNRDVVKRIAAKLESLGVQFHVVVPEDGVDAFLKERVQRANQLESPLGLPKMFVSVHSNALGANEWDDRARGVEVWHYPGSDSGQRLASAFQEALMHYLPGWIDRGIKAHQRGRRAFYVLSNTRMPAVLTENGFYTHPEEVQLLMQPETRQAIADAHVAAILKVEQEGWEALPLYPKFTAIP